MGNSKQMTRNKEINKWDQEGMQLVSIMHISIQKDLSKKAFELQCTIFFLTCHVLN